MSVISHIAALPLALAALFLLPARAASAPKAPAEPGAAAGGLVEASLFIPDPGFAELGALEDPLPLPRLIDAAFLASGVSLEDLPAYAERMDELLAELRSEIGAVETGGAATLEARGEALLAALHRGPLKTYREDATTLDGILDRGDFNCVSSAVLYMISALSLGLEASGIRTVDHAFCILALPAGPGTKARSIDVETTNPQGFDPGSKKEFTDSFGRVTGFSYVPPGRYGKRFPVDARGMAGLIIVNRASKLEREGLFAEAMRLAVDREALRRDADSLSFLADCVGNMVALLSGKKDYAGAETLARKAAAGREAEPRLAWLARTATYNTAVALTKEGRREKAFESAAALVAAYPKVTSYAELASGILSSIAETAARAQDFEGARRAVAERASRAGPTPGAAAKAGRAALAIVDELELAQAVNALPFPESAERAAAIAAGGRIDRQRYAKAVAAIYGNEANRIAKEGDWLAAAAMADGGSARAPGDGSLAKLAATLRRNFVAEAHNRFAALYNARDYSGARAVAEEALTALPGNATLKADLALIK